MTIIASCGCALKEGEDTVGLRFKDWNCDAVTGFSKCVIYSEYCPSCAKRAKRWGSYIRTDAEETAWFDGPEQNQNKRVRA